MGDEDLLDKDATYIRRDYQEDVLVHLSVARGGSVGQGPQDREGRLTGRIDSPQWPSSASEWRLAGEGKAGRLGVEEKEKKGSGSDERGRAQRRLAMTSRGGG
ncbi:hypothetical protein E2562_013445 [Oryza meyeriana var. granulata]|uniref:Uncharacterized protein n=1 Tax=Oryza meyeriana var. granulata TaxID=110450 RepID=A0A6G1EA94_9ORYZ|nr:hypothetical protein E2562_013445 [Oryza meyeriana var. granulata]